jgi:hypothetical protein
VLVAGEQGVAAGARVLRRGRRGKPRQGRRGDMVTCCWAGPYLLTLIRRVHKLDTYQPTYPNFAKKIKIGYSSDTYPSRIRIRYVSDTRYTPSVEYPCNVDPCRVEALAFSPSSVALPGAPSKRRPWVRSRRRAQRCLLAEGEVPAGGTRDLSLWRATSRPAKCEIPRPNHPSQVDLFVPAAGGAMPVFVDGGNGEAPRKIP